mgnify:CR=1 FL=1
MRFLLTTLSISIIFSQGIEQIPSGTRPLGMGGAFVAVADDANTINWNPAGLPGLRRTEFTSTYSDLYRLGITHSYFGLVRNFSDRIAKIYWAYNLAKHTVLSGLIGFPFVISIMIVLMA